MATRFVEARIARRHDLDEPGSQVAIENQQRRALGAAREKLDRLLELRLAGEIDAEEFQAHRSQFQGEVAKLEAAFQQLATKSVRDQMTLENCIHFAANAYRDFAGGSVKTKRAIATALSDSYLLTLGRLAIEPHPLLDRMRTFEPPKSPPQQVEAGHFVSLNPLWCAWLDNIRTLVAESNMRLVDYTVLNEPAKEPEANKTIRPSSRSAVNSRSIQATGIAVRQDRVQAEPMDLTTLDDLSPRKTCHKAEA